MKKIHTILISSLLTFAIVTTAMPVQQAQAQTNTLAQQIETLLTQIRQLQTQLALLAGAATCPTFNQNHTFGSSGAEVTALQTYLLNLGYSIPAGATGYFGPQTLAAVARFQRAEGISPASGNFGPLTRARIRALCNATPPPTPPTGQPGPDLQGEGELGSFQIESADDITIRESESDAPIAILTLEATDGDIQLSRIDISLVADSANDEEDPWDVFEDISLWVDGDKIAEEKINNRSDFLNRTTGTVRLADLDLILEEDEEVEIIVAVSVQNSVDGAGDRALWSVSVDSVRFSDADGVIMTDTSTDDLGQSVDFEIVERGAGEELKFRTTSSNPSAQTIIVDNTQRTNGVTILAYSIEALGNDIELDRLYVNVQTGMAEFDDVVAAIALKIGNKTFRQDEIVTTGDYSNNNVLVSFDIDREITIDEDDQEVVAVVVDFKAQTNYANGETILAQVTSQERDRTRAEGEDDIESFSGSIVGNLQTLISEGIYILSDSVNMTTDTLGTNSTIGEFIIEFTVNAVEDDFYITDNTSTDNLTSIGGVQYSVETTAGTPASVSASLSSTAREDTNGVFTIREGRSEKFTLTVTVDAAAAGNHRVVLDALRFSSNPDGVTNGSTYTATPTNEFRTPYQFINN